MLSVHVICVGKLKEKFFQQACEEYCKRLGSYCKLNVVELPEAKLPASPTLGDIAAALDKEGDAVRKKLPEHAYLAALCIEGDPCSSEDFSLRLQHLQTSAAAKHLVFLIGGSHGLHPSLKREAKWRLSMSPMTFPHHLARVMLLEQLYRAFKIAEGSSYHK